ncbi:MAG: hypothetical protein OHK0013_31100 [Sandaracinaceae bacterium]
MTRETLEAILSDAPGATTSKPDKKADKSEERVYAFGEEHRVSLYLSMGDAGTVLSEVVKLTLGAVVKVEQKDRTVVYVEYPSVQGLAVRPPRNAGESPRTGF